MDSNNEIRQSIRPAHKKFLFLDAGDTLIKLTFPPGQIYYEIISIYLSLESVSTEIQNKAFYYAWKIMSNRTHGRDRFSHHPGGEVGWWRELIQHYLDFFAIDYKKVAFDPLFDLIYTKFEDISIWQYDPGIEYLHKTMSDNNCDIGMISNWDSRLKKLLFSLGLNEYFKFIIISAEVGFEKPSPVIFNEAKRLTQMATGLIYAGDKPELDYYPPQSLGWEAYLVGNPPMKIKDSLPQEKIVKNLTELTNKICDNLNT